MVLFFFPQKPSDDGLSLGKGKMLTFKATNGKAFIFIFVSTYDL